MALPSTSPASAQRHPLHAGLWMLLSVVMFSLMDATMKRLSANYPPLQVAMLRGACSLPFVLPWILATGGLRSMLPRRWWLHLLRGALGIAMIACFTFALKRIPLTTGYTIFFVSPMIVAMLAAPLLGEKVGLGRWCAIGVGLCGVLWVLHPTGAGFAWLPGVMVLVAATSYATASVLVSVQTRTETSQSMVVGFLLLMALGAGVLAIPQWTPLRMADAWQFGVLGLTGALGQIALTRAFQLGEASKIAPLEYTGILWALAWDWLLWRTLPSAWVIPGAVLVVASGLYLLRREGAHHESERP